MNSIGIIAEFNPFHNGHKYIIDKAKEYDNSCVIVIMSGDYVQRGECAIYDKYLRTRCALNNGADLVIMLPVNLSTASSEAFAEGGVRILEKLGADNIIFGCEHVSDTTLSSLDKISVFFLDEPVGFSQALKDNLIAGMSYPLARSKACEAYLSKTESDLLSSPNALLGIEYIKAIKKYACKLKPIIINRTLDNYNSDELSDYSSATAIRKLINNKCDLAPFLDDSILSTLTRDEYYNYPLRINDFTPYLNYKLWEMFKNNKNLTEYDYIDQHLANRMLGCFHGSNNFTDFVMKLKSKNITYAHISRALIRLVLDIKGTDTSCNYIRVLGMNSKGMEYLSTIKKSIDVPIITKVSKGYDNIKHPWNIYFKNDCDASLLYKEAIFNRYNVTSKNDYQTSPIINS